MAPAARKLHASFLPCVWLHSCERGQLSPLRALCLVWPLHQSPGLNLIGLIPGFSAGCKSLDVLPGFAWFNYCTDPEATLSIVTPIQQKGFFFFFFFCKRDSKGFVPLLDPGSPFLSNKWHTNEFLPTTTILEKSVSESAFSFPSSLILSYLPKTRTVCLFWIYSIP